MTLFGYFKIFYRYIYNNTNNTNNNTNNTNNKTNNKINNNKINNNKNNSNTNLDKGISLIGNKTQIQSSIAHTCLSYFKIIEIRGSFLLGKMYLMMRFVP